MDSNQILLDDKDPQVLISGWSQDALHKSTNPRWQTAAILKKNIKLPYLHNRLTYFDEIWRGNAFGPYFEKPI